MKDTWLPTGHSDPVTYTCTCPVAGTKSGLVLLFYRYYAASPALPTSYEAQGNDPQALANFHTGLTQSLALGGKLRISNEGINITVGGTVASIGSYVSTLITHWSLAGLDLSNESKRNDFFKPTPGCACVFGGAPANVRVTSEITPMGVTGYAPKNWDLIESLSPAEFHDRCFVDGEKMLVDVRNYYESRIGYFVDPMTGEAALRPPVRRFSQWPQYVKQHLASKYPADQKIEDGKARQIMTYCTGGIRCEKGARFLQENMGARNGDKVSTLKGGIAAYLTWMDEEIRAERKRPEDSLFKGRNYVFDARGSTGLVTDVVMKPVSRCHECGELSDRLSKCRSKGCHLVLVVCEDCALRDPRCCQSCRDFDSQASLDAQLEEKPKIRPICACEKQREAELWGPPQEKTPKSQGWRTAKKRGTNGINIQVKTFD